MMSLSVVFPERLRYDPRRRTRVQREPFLFASHDPISDRVSKKGHGIFDRPSSTATPKVMLGKASLLSIEEILEGYSNGQIRGSVSKGEESATSALDEAEWQPDESLSPSNEEKFADMEERSEISWLRDEHPNVSYDRRVARIKSSCQDLDMEELQNQMVALSLSDNSDRDRIRQVLLTPPPKLQMLKRRPKLDRECCGRAYGGEVRLSVAKNLKAWMK